MNSNNKPLIYFTFCSLFFITSILTVPSTAVAKIYKWTDASGKTHYTATPPPAKARAKTEEFKVRKIKKSSLTYQGDDQNQASSTQNNNASKTETSPQSQCRNALSKVPEMASSLKRKLKLAKKLGKVNDEEYQEIMLSLKKASSKSKSKSMQECLQGYKRGGKNKTEVDMVAENSAEDALRNLIQKAALKRSAQQ